MSDVPEGITRNLNLVDAVARIERQQAETRKFVAKQLKLMSEAAKYNRDRFLGPAAVVIATLGPIAAIAPILIRAAGR